MVLLCFLCLVMGQNSVVKSKSPRDEHWARLVVMALAISAVATLYLLLILGFSVRLVDGGGPWFVTGHALEDGELFDATRNAVAFATFTIAGGAAYLAYRRQRATDRTNALTTSRYEQDEFGRVARAVHDCGRAAGSFVGDGADCGCVLAGGCGGSVACER
ncbi:hypothetical protein GS891_25500 [Rhodococcus hoagii]|nr:hypothetical protein [Prescottella equi]